MGVVDWINYRPISRSLVKPRNAGDYIMNESWQEPGGLRFHAQDQVNFRIVYSSYE
jgi:hypothetical protein